MRLDRHARILVGGRFEMAATLAFSLALRRVGYHARVFDGGRFEIVATLAFSLGFVAAGSPRLRFLDLYVGGTSLSHPLGNGFRSPLLV